MFYEKWDLKQISWFSASKMSKKPKINFSCCCFIFFSKCSCTLIPLKKHLGESIHVLILHLIPLIYSVRKYSFSYLRNCIDMAKWCAQGVKASAWLAVGYFLHATSFTSSTGKEKSMSYSCGLQEKSCCTLTWHLEVKLQHQMARVEPGTFQDANAG